MRLSAWVLAAAACVVGLGIGRARGDEPPNRWEAPKACAWYDARPWLVGCNFVPSTAVNDVEMWQHDLFHKDGSPFDPAEVTLIRRMTGVLTAGQR